MTLCPRFFITDWLPLQGTPEEDTHLCVIGDVYGQSEALSFLFEWLEGADIHKEPKIVSLGNVVGHGPGSLKCLNMMNNTPFGKAIKLPGSEEIKLAKAMRFPKTPFSKWEMDGGTSILEEAGIIGHNSEDAAIALFEILGKDFPSQILEGQTHYRSGDRLMVHAGVSPHIPHHKFLAQSAHNTDLIQCHWSTIQTPFLNWTKGWNADQSLVVVHGHTPEQEEWFGGWSDITNFYKPSHSRINLNANSKRISQISWAEFVDGFVRIGIVSMRNSDVV
jgi:serine/threonine protein phosphatase 1